VSIFVIGVWFWASVVLSAVAVAFAAALVVSLTGKAAPAIAGHVKAWGDHCRATVAFHDPLPSSPSSSHSSFRRPL
jgi:hypothetical protein